MKIKNRLVFVLICCLSTSSIQLLTARDNVSGRSVYTERPNDPKAVYFTREYFDIAADGAGDDAPALQAAIDLVVEQSRTGIVFIPEGTYRLGTTVKLWRGIRLIGYGRNRPVFKLGDNTPGYQEEDGKYMIHFTHDPHDFSQTPSWDIVPAELHPRPPQDGTWSTFYSGIYNINFEIADGNPAAIAVRYHIAQVCALENIDFNIGNGRGAVEDMGNLIENCTFRGGEWGIKTVSSPPGWQNTVLDCTFEGQRQASVITNGARMTLIRGRFINSPIGILVPDRDKLFVKDSWFQDIKTTAIQINNYTPEDLQVNLLNLSFSNVPFSVRFDGRVQGASRGEVQMEFEAPSSVYTIKSFSQGLHIENPQGNAVNRYFGSEIEQSPLQTLGEFPLKEIPALPPQNTWINISDLGAKGDGMTDDTDVFEKAIARYNTIYIPMGKYLLSRTLTFRDQTILIGFHPSMTQLVMDNMTPGFTDASDTRPLLVAPENGSNGITGIGFDLGINPGVTGIKWMAGINSYIDDGLFRAGSSGMFGEGQTHSIWVTDGGGGTFKNIWIVDTKTKLPFYASNTSTPGNIYQISIEHHKDIEVKLEKVENWSFYALQLEQDRGSEKALGIYIRDCRNLLFANFISHRTTGVWTPYHHAILIRNSREITIRGSEIRGAVFPFDNALLDEITGTVITHRLFTRLFIK